MLGKDFAAYKYLDGRGIFYLFPDLCKGCGLCLEKCPVDTIGWTDTPGFLGTLTPAPGFGDPCIACRICEFVCPDCAIRIDKTAPDKTRKINGHSPVFPSGLSEKVSLEGLPRNGQ